MERTEEPYRLSIPRFLLGMLTTRFDFDRFAHRWAADDPRSAQQAHADPRSTVTERFNVPGAPPEAPLSHLVIHPTDTDWCHGDGPEVRGPGAAVVTVLGGRAVALDGPGVPELRRRLTPTA